MQHMTRLHCEVVNIDKHMNDLDTLSGAQNAGSKYAGSITAALFLQKYVDTKKVQWAHVDIAGCAHPALAACPPAVRGCTIRTMPSCFDALSGVCPGYPRRCASSDRLLKRPPR